MVGRQSVQVYINDKNQGQLLDGNAVDDTLWGLLLDRT